MNSRVVGTIGNRNDMIPVHNNYPCKGTISGCPLPFHRTGMEGLLQGHRSLLDENGFYADGYKRWVNRKELDQRISEWTITKTPNEVMEILQNVGVAATPCEDTEDRFLDPHFQERQILVDVEHPSTGVDWVPNVICRLSETPGAFGPAPRLGEHNDYVFGELLGLPKEEIQRLMENKIIY